MKLIKKEDYKVLYTDLKESTVISNLMDDFPPICKQDPLEVRVMYMKEYFEMTGQTIKISDIPDEMYSGALPIAKSKRSKNRAMTEAEYVEDDSEKVAKKAKKSKANASQQNPTASNVLSIQQEAQELDASEVLDKRIRSKNQVDTAQPSKKKKMATKKLRQASLATEEEKEAAVQKAFEIAAQISVPADVLLKKTIGEAAQAAIELCEDLHQLVASGELLKAPEEKATGSEAATSEAAASRGNPDVSNSANIIEVEFGSETSIHSQDSSDLDDVTLSLIYKDISPSTKPKQNTTQFEPVYPAVLISLGKMSQRRVDICNKLPADHPLQPPIIEPLNIAPADTHTSTSTHSNQPSSSHLVIQPITPPQPDKIPSPPTMYLDSSLLADVCENIFQELNKLIQSRHDLIHENNYKQFWKRLKERTDNVLNALQRTCIDDQNIAQQKLKDWLKGVTSNLEEVRVLKTWVKHPLCLRQRNETDFIPAGIHPRELNIIWLTRMNVKQASPGLVVMQRNAELENENRQLKKELLEQKLLLIEYKAST